MSRNEVTLSDAMLIGSENYDNFVDTRVDYVVNKEFQSATNASQPNPFI